MEIRTGHLDHPAIIKLLTEHHQEMLKHSPPGSVHALNLNALAAPNISFWSLWQDKQLAGCGALKQLDNLHGEIKSMRTANNFLRMGVARSLLQHIITQAEVRGYQRLSLETGTMDAFLPAHKLYQTFGFDYCPPFDSYQEDPYSTFMTKELIAHVK